MAYVEMMQIFVATTVVRAAKTTLTAQVIVSKPNQQSAVKFPVVMDQLATLFVNQVALSTTAPVTKHVQQTSIKIVNSVATAMVVPTAVTINVPVLGDVTKVLVK